MIYNNILNELLDSGNKFKGVPKGKYDAEHAPYTFYINKTISLMNVFFSLPTIEGTKNYVFIYKNKEESEIHFSIQNEDGSFSNDLTALNNAAEVMGAIVYFSKLAIKMYNPLTINIICKDKDISRKRVYILLAKKVGLENGFIIKDVSAKPFPGNTNEMSQTIKLVKNEE